MTHSVNIQYLLYRDFSRGQGGTLPPEKFCPPELGLNDELVLESAATLNNQLKFCLIYSFEKLNLPLLTVSRKSLFLVFPSQSGTINHWYSVYYETFEGETFMVFTIFTQLRVFYTKQFTRLDTHC